MELTANKYPKFITKLLIITLMMHGSSASVLNEERFLAVTTVNNKLHKKVHRTVFKNADFKPKKPKSEVKIQSREATKYQ